ncbi:hypothetical protein CLHOM_05420 [Clostridium homopropionicum DSM 5847]|uniref:Uncharacterized protein n=1 Tax=Clostridium homopropionicum DSM 5847 TaxID=1121318 RepID=A0A0L6ZD92_9CLOT|nr:hypothetical protein [Clostridium homopropionicum]KOA20954.1 hypothetical protein CLHOM_05420 [Clostridium homopropionicum DSM 5847]SFG01273.1 hypothetical protein SAMN04488501_104178 [Clostridium homopropionicum]
MFIKDKVITVGSNIINIYTVNSKNKIEEVKNVDDITSLDKEINKENLYILLENEEIHIKKLLLPNTSNNNINSIIMNKLNYLYGKNTQDIYYTYSKWESNNKEIEIILYCINCHKNRIRNLQKNKFQIKKVNLIQLWYIKYYQKSIVEKDYIVIIKHNSSIYTLYFCDKRLLSNQITTEENLLSSLIFIINKMKVYNCIFTKVYSINLDQKIIEKYLKLDFEKDKININVINLGSITEEEIIGYYIENRRK